MEFFNKAKAVRLRSHFGKYLLANDDEETVRQSRNGSSSEARWTVEFVHDSCHFIRLKSCYNKYLTASEEPFSFGLTGKKVVQTTVLSSENDCCIVWEPMISGFGVKLRTRDGNFLRANGGTPPWRNSVTHDVPHRTATQDWVLWTVDVLDILDSESSSNCKPFASILSNGSSYSEDCAGSDSDTPMVSFATMSAMEIFEKAKTVRLRSHHDKYLLAEDDEESVCQDRNGAGKNAKWTVEILENAGVLRLKSCYGKYLSASNMSYFFGVTGKKVVQSLPSRLDLSLEWEPIREGIQVKLKTRYGHYLRANGGMPPLRNSITHDIPHRSSTQDWILWDVDIVEFQKSQEPASPQPLARTATPSPTRTSVPDPAATSARTPPRAQQPPPPQHVRAEPQPPPKQHFRTQSSSPPSQNVTAQPPALPQQYFRSQSPPPSQSVGAQAPPSLQEPPHVRAQSPPLRQQHFRAQPPSPSPPNLTELTPLSPKQQFKAQPPPPHFRTQTPPPLNVKSRMVKFVEKPLSEPTSPASFSLKSPGNEVNNTLLSPVNEGRLIVYEVVDDNGDVNKSKGEWSFTFKGSGVEQLKQIVKEVTGLNDIIVCSRNPLNGKPYPLRLHLPPNNATMNLVVVPSTSKLARDLK